MPIKWAPVNVPPRRRLQTLATGLYVYVVLCLPFVSLFLTCFFLFYFSTTGRAVLLLYLTYIYFDHKYRCSTIHGNGFATNISNDPIQLCTKNGRGWITDTPTIYKKPYSAQNPPDLLLNGVILNLPRPIFYIYVENSFDLGFTFSEILSSCLIIPLLNSWMLLRNNCLTKHLRDYFPIELIKTTDLTPNRNYLIASFPHGVIGTGITNNMGNNISKWLKLFPGIRPKIATLDIHFYVPFLREILRLWGLISCSRESLIYHLSTSNDPQHPGNKDGFTANAVAVLVGGAQESLDSHPGRYVLTLKNRKGFVKIAIRTGAAIVPSFSFGEVDIYEQVNNPPNSPLRRFQNYVKELTGVSPLIVRGRGFFQYNFGFIPLRKHIVQVVGAPIEVKQTFEADPQYIDEIHEKVVTALEEMFEKYKHKYIENADTVKLIIN